MLRCFCCEALDFPLAWGDTYTYSYSRYYSYHPSSSNSFLCTGRCQKDILVNLDLELLVSHTPPWYTFRFCAWSWTRFQFEPWDSYRLSEASVLSTALHVEGLDLSGETTEQDGLVDCIRHHPLWSFRNVLTTDSPKKGASSIKSQDIKARL